MRDGWRPWPPRPRRAAENRAVTKPVLTWFAVGGFQVKAALLIDPLSITMALFVTGVSTLIHLYSIGYMHGDDRFPTFFVYLNLFVFSMLVLVLADNFLFTFLGWEGVGTCSYFLIAFWHERESAATAGKKAFITNRVGDWGFMMAMFFAFWGPIPGSARRYFSSWRAIAAASSATGDASARAAIIGPMSFTVISFSKNSLSRSLVKPMRTGRGWSRVAW